ncbi:hypothetical protein LJB89_00900 [Tyzzerella sp. OttesenSCG-928-J15]|nr:hypothetical protein [Tyzzerella sp. OttesenSCG-928-J15]
MDDGPQIGATQYSWEEIKELRAKYRNYITEHKLCTVFLVASGIVFFFLMHSGIGSLGFYDSAGYYRFYSNLAEVISLFVACLLFVIRLAVQSSIKRRVPDLNEYLVALEKDNLTDKEIAKKRVMAKPVEIFLLIVIAVAIGMLAFNSNAGRVYFDKDSMTVSEIYSTKVKTIDYDKLHYVSIDDESYERIRICFQWNDETVESGRGIVALNLGRPNKFRDSFIEEVKLHYSGGIKYSKQVPIKLN